MSRGELAYNYKLRFRQQAPWFIHCGGLAPTTPRFGTLRLFPYLLLFLAHSAQIGYNAGFD